MQIKDKIHHFRGIFFHPRVFPFILTGTCIIFLTFLTTDNALEIAISGIASVFIGIGVNNFSSVEMTQRNLQTRGNNDQHLLAMLELAALKSKHIQSEAIRSGYTAMIREAEELEKILYIATQVLNNAPRYNA